MKYFKLYIPLLFAYFFFSTTWIEVNGTLPMWPKMIATGICMGILAGYSIYEYGWSGLLLWPFSVLLWDTFIDGFTGLYFHGNFFFMSILTWPDKYILPVVNNGVLYYISKSIALVVFGGLTNYIKEREK